MTGHEILACGRDARRLGRDNPAAGVRFELTRRATAGARREHRARSGVDCRRGLWRRRRESRRPERAALVRDDERPAAPTTMICPAGASGAPRDTWRSFLGTQAGPA